MHVVPVYVPVASVMPETLSQLHTSLRAYHVQPVGQLYYVPVVPVGAQQPPLPAEHFGPFAQSDFESQVNVNAIKFVGIIAIADNNPTFILGSNQGRKKHAEIWEFYKNKKGDSKRPFILGRYFFCLYHVF